MWFLSPVLLSISALGLVFLSSCHKAEPTALVTYPPSLHDTRVLRTAVSAIETVGIPVRLDLPDTADLGGELLGGEEEIVGLSQASLDLPNLVASIGPQSSRSTLLGGPIFAEAGIPVISPTATSRRLESLAPWVFAMAPSGREEGAFMAAFLLDRLEVRRVTLFYLVNDEYGLDLADGLTEALAAQGVTPVDLVGITGGSDFPRWVEQSLAKTIPEAVMVAARGPEVFEIVSALHRLKPGIPVVVGDGAPLESTFPPGTDLSGAPVYGATWWHPDGASPESRRFATAFRDAHGVLPSAAEAMYFDAFMLAAEAVKEGGAEPSLVFRYLQELGNSRRPFQGVTGPISFEPGHKANLVMVQRVADEVVMVNWSKEER